MKLRRLWTSISLKVTAKAGYSMGFVVPQTEVWDWRMVIKKVGSVWFHSLKSGDSMQVMAKAGYSSGLVGPQTEVWG